MRTLVVLSLFALLQQSISQHLILPRDDNARTFIVSVQSDFLEVSRTNGTFRCIGTFVSDSAILTAASCVVDRVDNPRDLFLALFSTLRAWPNQGLSGLFVIEAVHIHPEYLRTTNPSSNLAILKVCNFFAINVAVYQNRFRLVAVEEVTLYFDQEASEI